MSALKEIVFKRKTKATLVSLCFHSWLGTEQQSYSRLDLFLLTFSYDTTIRNLMSTVKMRHEALEGVSLMLCESKIHTCVNFETVANVI